MSADVVATWDVALSDGIHSVLFEHGTTTGKRVIILDGVEILRKNWMFRLVGKEEFTIGKKTKATIRIEAVSGFAYEYTLNVNGKPLKTFTENRKKTAKVWNFVFAGKETRIVLGKRLERLLHLALIKELSICHCFLLQTFFLSIQFVNKLFF